MSFRLAHATLWLAGALLCSGVSSAGEPGLMHCFYFTPIAEASEADWDAFYKATDELPGKIEGLRRAWVGKLREWPAVSQQVQLGREHGVCMELTDEAALQAYAEHPAHEAWVEVYEKVRVAGTITFDILGR